MRGSPMKEITVSLRRLNTEILPTVIVDRMFRCVYLIEASSWCRHIGGISSRCGIWVRCRWQGVCLIPAGCSRAFP